MELVRPWCRSWVSFSGCFDYWREGEDKKNGDGDRDGSGQGGHFYALEMATRGGRGFCFRFGIFLLMG